MIPEQGKQDKPIKITESAYDSGFYDDIPRPETKDNKIKLKEKVCPFMSGWGTESYNDFNPNILLKCFTEVMCKREYCALWIAGLSEGDGICGMARR